MANNWINELSNELHENDNIVRIGILAIQLQHYEFLTSDYIKILLSSSSNLRDLFFATCGSHYKYMDSSLSTDAIGALFAISSIEGQSIISHKKLSEMIEAYNEEDLSLFLLGLDSIFSSTKTAQDLYKTFLTQLKFLSNEKTIELYLYIVTNTEHIQTKLNLLVGLSALLKSNNLNKQQARTWVNKLLNIAKDYQIQDEFLVNLSEIYLKPFVTGRVNEIIEGLKIITTKQLPSEIIVKVFHDLLSRNIRHTKDFVKIWCLIVDSQDMNSIIKDYALKELTRRNIISSIPVHQLRWLANTSHYSYQPQFVNVLFSKAESVDEIKEYIITYGKRENYEDIALILAKTWNPYNAQNAKDLIRFLQTNNHSGLSDTIQTMILSGQIGENDKIRFDIIYEELEILKKKTANIRNLVFKLNEYFYNTKQTQYDYSKLNQHNYRLIRKILACFSKDILLYKELFELLETQNTEDGFLSRIKNVIPYKQRVSGREIRLEIPETELLDLDKHLQFITETLYKINKNKLSLDMRQKRYLEDVQTKFSKESDIYYELGILLGNSNAKWFSRWSK